jgi:hypothetical protein
MARAKLNKLYRTFVKGMITEAGPLTYPEDASIDEDNCVIFRKGNRSRRLGMDFEDNYELSQYALNDLADATRVYRWESVNNDATVNFLVHRIGTSIYFYDLSQSSLSSGLKLFSIDLNDFAVPNVTDVGQAEVSMVGGKGYLFVVGSSLEPFLVQYDSDADTISTERIYIQIRDFKGVNDALANDQEPATLTDAHKYNLMNQGWIDARNAGSGATVQYFDTFGGIGSYPGPTTQVITDYFTQFSKYPANNKQWWVARDSTTGDFDAELLGKFFSGTARAPRGHFIVDAFYVDRTAVSGVPNLELNANTSRPPTVSFFAGRVWYACDSTVYFSQVLDDKAKAGFCYQEADPTSEDISDLIASDGGVVPIPEMAKAVKLVPIGGGILVFATNGIWYVSGTQAGFTATDISVTKVNPIGTDSPDSIVEAEGQIFWWSKVGIMGMSQKTGMFGSVDGAFERTNISEQTIQSFYNHDIPEMAKRYAKGVYDPATNTVQWLFRSSETPSVYMYDRILQLDLSLSAFYPWTVETVGPYISDIFTTPTLNELVDTEAIRSSFVKYLCAVPSDEDYKYTFGFFKSAGFADWITYDGVGVAYLSFVETGYELLDDAMRKKQAPYVFCYFRRTEEEYVEDGSDYTVDKPSSCYFQVKWDWANSSNSNKWSSKIQVYRHRRAPMFSEDDLTFDTGFPVVVTRNKVRGSGKAIQFRFESDEIGNDFDLLGWAVPFSGNTES